MEYIALASTASESTWMSSLLQNLGISQTKLAILYCDNLSVVHLSVNHVFNNRSKHIEVDYHYVRERITFGVLEIRHILSTSQLANIFTKSLLRPSFQNWHNKLNVVIFPNISLRQGGRAGNI